MKIKLEKLYVISVKDENGFAPLSSILKTNLPVEKSFKIAQAMEKIKSEIVAFEKVKKELFLKYGEAVLNEKGEETANRKIKDENIDVFNQEINKLLCVEVEIDLPEIKLPELTGSKLSPKDIMALDFMIKE